MILEIAENQQKIKRKFGNKNNNKSIFKYLII